MAKMLNLDDFASEERVLILKGKEYPMVDISVKEFIDLTAREHAVSENMPFSEQIALTIDMIQRRFPTCPREELEAMNMAQLNAILEFARGDIVEEEGTEGN